MREIVEHLMIPASLSTEIAKRVITDFVKAEKLSRIADGQEPTPTVAHVIREGGPWIVALRSGPLQSQAPLKEHPVAILPVSQPFVDVHQRFAKLLCP
jgi:hypothetical protein